MRNDGWKITGKLGFLKGQIEMVTENRIDQCIECCLYRDECDGKGGESKLEAFVGAITQTSDDVFAESMKNNHRLVEKYVQQDDGKYPLTMKRVERGLHPVNRSEWRAS